MPKIFKASSVYVDQDNKVQILAGPPKNMNVLEPSKTKEVEPVADTTISNKEKAEDVLAKAKQEADSILKKAKMESEAILAEAEQNAENIVTEAKFQMEEEGKQLYEISRSEGYQCGVDEATKKANELKAAAQKVLDDAEKEREEIRLAVEPDAVNLIINIVEKILGDAVELDPTVIVSLIRQGFAGTTLTGQAVVRVSVEDHPHAVAGREELEAAAGGTVELEIVKDSSLNKADCIIDTSFGGIDASLSSQFEGMKTDLTSMLEQST